MNGEGVSEDKAEAVRWYRMAAEQGYVFAQVHLGLAYDTGEGVPEDAAEAVRWYQTAAEQGYALAQFSVGLAYENGRGVLKHPGEAVRWYQTAAEQGHAEAQHNLGRMYALGQDRVRGHMWLNIASANGSNMSGEIRDLLERLMTRDEVNRATELARMCMESNYKNCER